VSFEAVGDDRQPSEDTPMLNLELANTLYKDRQREVDERMRTRSFRQALADRYEPAFTAIEHAATGTQPRLRMDPAARTR
jgi:hypothetical protein